MQSRQLATAVLLVIMVLTKLESDGPALGLAPVVLSWLSFVILLLAGAVNYFPSIFSGSAENASPFTASEVAAIRNLLGAVTVSPPSPPVSQDLPPSESQNAIVRSQSAKE